MMKKVKVALEIVELVVSIGTILSQAGEALVSLFDKEQKESDFEQVRGDFESNDFVRSVLDHIKSKTELGEKAINSLLS